MQAMQISQDVGPVPRRLFHLLRCKMQERGYDQVHLARALGMSRMTLSSHINGRWPWTLTEMYSVCDLLEIRYDQLHLYFPKDGKDMA